jgi:hypothetical protein
MDALAAATDTLRSSKSLREWADEYCASPKYLKEFVYEKVHDLFKYLSSGILTPLPQFVYGWNLEKLESAIRSSIHGGCLYQGHLTVEFQRGASKIYIRPDNKLSRTLSNKWLKFLFWILLIYPFIWLYKRFHSKGGGRWEVGGGAFAFRRLETAAEPNLLSENAANPTLYQTQDGELIQIVGIKEGEWLQKWQATIVQGVNSRFQSPVPLQNTTEAHLRGLPVAILDD